VILYFLLTGEAPFLGSTQREVAQSIRADKLRFDITAWGRVSQEARCLSMGLLCQDEATRLSAVQAAEHPWLVDASVTTSAPLTDEHLQSLRSFCAQNKLKKAALHIIAQQLRDEEIQHLRDTFTTLDTSHDGVVTLKELAEGLAQLYTSGIPDDLAVLMAQLDVNGSEALDYSEFLAATLERRHYEEEGLCWAAFRAFDKDGNGRLDKKELRELLDDAEITEAMGCSSVEQVLEDWDTDGDGTIDFDEFMSLMRDERGTRGRPRKNSKASISSASTCFDGSSRISTPMGWN
jgi:calcium-dependent protein kinase